MSQDYGDDRRRQGRSVTDRPLVLRDSTGRAVDGHARAHDIGSGGFRAQTRCRLRPGDKVGFTIQLDEETSVRGHAVIEWSATDPFGPYSAGARIAKMPWRDRGRLRRALAEPGYDFDRLIRLSLKTFFWVVVALGLHNLVFHQPVLRRFAIELIPVMLAAAVMGWSLYTLLVKKSE